MAEKNIDEELDLESEDFNLENNVLYSHCYGRIITKDFLNYDFEKIDFNFVCNRHSCLIYKTSIIYGKSYGI